MAFNRQNFYVLGYNYENVLELMTTTLFRSYDEAADYRDTIHPNYRAFIVQAR